MITPGWRCASTLELSRKEKTMFKLPAWKPVITGLVYLLCMAYTMYALQRMEHPFDLAPSHSHSWAPCT